MLEMGFFRGTQQEQAQGAVQIFQTGDTVTATAGFRTWMKPRGFSMALMVCIGGGAGGGGGGTTLAGGGGGGGANTVTRVIIPLLFLPDTLYILVGAGGAGGTAGNAGTNGQRSYVTVYPNSSVFNIVCVAGAPTGGGAGTAGAGAGGNGGRGHNNCRKFGFRGIGILCFDCGAGRRGRVKQRGWGQYNRPGIHRRIRGGRRGR